MRGFKQNVCFVSSDYGVPPLPALLALHVYTTTLGAQDRRRFVAACDYCVPIMHAYPTNIQPLRLKGLMV